MHLPALAIYLTYHHNWVQHKSQYNLQHFIPTLASISIYFPAKGGINAVDFSEICVVPSYDS